MEWFQVSQIYYVYCPSRIVFLCFKFFFDCGAWPNNFYKLAFYCSNVFASSEYFLVDKAMTFLTCLIWSRNVTNFVYISLQRSTGIFQFFFILWDLKKNKQRRESHQVNLLREIPQKFEVFMAAESIKHMIYINRAANTFL